jgi:Ion channel
VARLPFGHLPNAWLLLALVLQVPCLTSVGFGEITPASDHARSLVMIQQMMGVLYFALVISRLVTLQTRRAEGERDRGP